MNLPSELLLSLKDAPGFDLASFEAIHGAGAQVTSIRINPSKQAALSFPTDHSVPWSSNGYYLSERPSFTLDPLFHAGAYYVQEASSMFLEQAIKQLVDLSQPLRVLDLCAAPGGKSTLIQSLISAESLLVSNEVVRQRVNILSENLTKWGALNVVVSSNDAADFRLPNFFDLMVIDAPCSGSGLFRKDEAAMDEWSLANVEMCSVRQKKILADAFGCLKKDGVLIYSTCSYSVSENEDIADWIISRGMEPVKLDVLPEWNIVESVSSIHKANGYRFYPDKLKGEGFFLAVFRKTSGDTSIRVPKKNRFKISSRQLDALKKFINADDNLAFLDHKENILAVPANRENDILLLQSTLYLKKAGVNLGSVIRDELVPAHELAMSNIISQEVTRCESDLTTALDYLRRRDVNFGDTVKGWNLVTFKSIGLGWIKSLGNRVNNYYPKEWRIHNK